MIRVKYLNYYLCDVLTRRSKTASKVLKKRIVVTEGASANEYLRNVIFNDQPFALVRPGFVEIDDFCYYDELQYWPPNGLYKKERRLRVQFDRDMDYDRYERELRERLLVSDAIGVFKTYKYKYIHDTYFKDKPMLPESVLCPIEYDDPWTKALSGKKVLIVSVFSELIKKQYSIINKVFPVNNPWPQMKIETLQSVWYGSRGNRDNRFGSYFEAVQYLYNECMKHEFDVALLCCSKFGVDLAPMLKQAGKIAIQMGGDMQIMFGIRGKRWDDNKTLKKYYNDYWIRASIEETGATEQAAISADGGCYW